MTRQKRQSILVAAVRFVSGFTEKHVSNYASGTAFFFFISLIPFCILLSTLLPLTGIDEETFTEIVTVHTPEIVEGLVRNIIRDAFASSGTVFSLSLIAILYASGKGMIALIQGMNVVYGIREHRSYIRIVIVAAVYMVLFMALIIVFLLVGVFGEMIYGIITPMFPHLTASLSWLMPVRPILITSFPIVLFLLMYTFVPAKNQKLLRQLPGALFATVGWIVFSDFFSIVMSRGSIYSTYYGSLATIVIFMLWMYGCLYILLIGGYINAFISNKQKKR